MTPRKLIVLTRTPRACPGLQDVHQLHQLPLAAREEPPLSSGPTPQPRPDVTAYRTLPPEAPIPLPALQEHQPEPGPAREPSPEPELRAERPRVRPERAEPERAPEPELIVQPEGSAR